MSILLEALRKSERGQQSAQTPTIHTQQYSVAGDKSINRWPLVLLLLVTFVLIAWIVWRQYDTSSDAYQPPVALPVNHSAVPQTRSSEAPTAITASDSGNDNDSRPVANQQRTPVESYQQPVPEVTTAEMASSTTGPSDLPDPVSMLAGANSNTETATVTESDDDEQPQSAVLIPEPIDYWELPDSIREDVPQMKFSVLVYAGEPADRFVLINGQRLAENDEYMPGLVVEKIRRDGVVFSYHLYQFLIKR